MAEIPFLLYMILGAVKSAKIVWSERSKTCFQKNIKKISKKPLTLYIVFGIVPIVATISKT